MKRECEAEDMARCKVDFASIAWESPAAKVRFKVHREGDRQIRLVEFFKGFTEPDWCRKGHIGYVLEGRCEIDFNGRVSQYGPGDGIFIPPGEAHKHKASVIGDVVRVILVEDV